MKKVGKIKNCLKISAIVFSGLLFLFLSASFAMALEETFSQVASEYEVADRAAEPGDILSKKDDGLFRSQKRYDEDIYGVVAINPVITIGKTDIEGLPVVSYGVTPVKVSNDYEEIRKGDYITSSPVPGVGQKAVYDGFVLGRALEDLEGEEGVIDVLVNPREAVIDPDESWEEITFWEAIGRIVSALERDVPQLLRYLFAFFLSIGVLLIGFRSFVRSLREGLAGISRNPLARNSIRFSMILNLIGIFLLTIAGLGLALAAILL